MSFAVSSVNPVSLPSLPLGSYRKFPDKPVCYFAMCEDKILYIGKARSLFKRWSHRSHHRHGELQQYTNVRIAWIEFSDPELLLEIEEVLIRYFNPELNRHKVKKFKAQKGKPGKKGGNPQNFNNPEKALYTHTVAVRVEADLYEFVRSLPNRTEWLRQAIAAQAKRDMEQQKNAG